MYFQQIAERVAFQMVSVGALKGSATVSLALGLLLSFLFLFIFLRQVFYYVVLAGLKLYV